MSLVIVALWVAGMMTAWAGMGVCILHASTGDANLRGTTRLAGALLGPLAILIARRTRDDYRAFPP